MAKRIQMNKNRFLALQKMAEQKKNEAMNANSAMNDGGPDHPGIPKQTVNMGIIDVILQTLFVGYKQLVKLSSRSLTYITGIYITYNTDSKTLFEKHSHVIVVFLRR